MSPRDRNEGHTERIYGRQPVREALLARRRSMFRLYVREGAITAPELNDCLSLCRDRRIAVKRVPARHMEQLCAGVNHQGICLDCSSYPYLDESDCVALLRGVSSGLALVLDRVQDPQNVGSLLRSAECAGASAVVVCADSAAGVTPAVVRASAGASEHMKIARVRGLMVFIRRLRDELGWTFFALDSNPDATLCYNVDMTGPTGVVVGGESSGVRTSVRGVCSATIAIPLLGRVTSLNAGVAGALAMYERVRQRLAAGAEKEGM